MYLDFHFIPENSRKIALELSEEAQCILGARFERRRAGHVKTGQARLGYVLTCTLPVLSLHMFDYLLLVLHSLLKLGDSLEQAVND